MTSYKFIHQLMLNAASWKAVLSLFSDRFFCFVRSVIIMMANQNYATYYGKQRQTKAGSLNLMIVF